MPGAYLGAVRFLLVQRLLARSQGVHLLLLRAPALPLCLEQRLHLAGHALNAGLHLPHAPRQHRLQLHICSQRNQPKAAGEQRPRTSADVADF